jgi:hypothetical protein
MIALRQKVGFIKGNIRHKVEAAHADMVKGYIFKVNYSPEIKIMPTQ